MIECTVDTELPPPILEPRPVEENVLIPPVLTEDENVSLSRVSPTGVACHAPLCLLASPPLVAVVSVERAVGAVGEESSSSEIRSMHSGSVLTTTVTSAGDEALRTQVPAGDIAAAAGAVAAEGLAEEAAAGAASFSAVTLISSDPESSSSVSTVTLLPESSSGCLVSTAARDRSTQLPSISRRTSIVDELVFFSISVK